jgi:histidinol-phosphate aminotransferase
MTAPVSRRQWLVSTGLVAGSSVVLPRFLPALGAPTEFSGSYHDALLDMEREVTAARRAAGPIRLCFNENPFGMSPKAKAAITAAWSEHSQYDLASRNELPKVFAKHVGVDPSNVLITQGSSETLSIAAIAYGYQGSEVVLPWPTFEGLPNYAETLGATVHKVPLDANLGHDLAAMDARITNNVKLVFVCNPNNPTGTLADNAKLRDFVLSVSKRALVIVDEAYHDFVDEPSYRSMTDLVTKGANIIVSRTASKIHGIAGLRIGFAIARPDIIERLRPLGTGSPNAFGLNAAIASLQDTEYQNFVRARNKEGRDLLTATLKGLGKRVAPSQTNFVFFKTGMPVEKVQSAMMAKGFRIGRAFPPYTDWCRISIGTPDEMKGCVAALPEAVRA